ncbi:hypothetical protein J4H86_06100 [Spiractinospora alimapuensis]|uniref:hypothetical protein n=1 Tax=Spiractinospora alimapuensis TaxID=2820884 RepID=UPI001F22F900|nr:hypothetical protein [Spiractinospora alimapuensis]QVQ53337.1 hypothetical protein J4H86_06100 [Spiractinospora alimapuensis]
MAQSTPESTPPTTPPDPADGADVPATPPRPGRRPWILPVAAVAVIAVLVVGVAVVVTQWDTTVTPDPQRVAELEDEEAELDTTRVAELASLTEETRDALTPVAAELQTSQSAEEAPSDLDSLLTTVEEAEESFTDPPSGTTEHNLAWGGVESSVRLFASALRAHAAASEAEGDLAADLDDHAHTLTGQALASWEVSSGQVEVLAAAADHDVQLSLSAASTTVEENDDSAAAGAIESDPSPATADE